MTFIYGICLLITISVCIYNWLYLKEVKKINKQVQFLLPKNKEKMLEVIMYTSIAIIVILIMIVGYAYTNRLITY